MTTPYVRENNVYKVVCRCVQEAVQVAEQVTANYVWNPDLTASFCKAKLITFISIARTLHIRSTVIRYS